MEKALHQQSSNCLRVVLFGPESSGKTTLASALAKAFETEWVPEFARNYLQQKWDSQQAVCTLEDLHVIAHGQLEAENRALQQANKLLFCDTNIWVTKVWSETHFEGYCSPQIKQWTKQVHYNHYLLTAPDIPWEKDDLRDRPNQREAQFAYFEKTLIENQLPHTHIRGSHQYRMEQATEVIKNLIQKNDAH